MMENHSTDGNIKELEQESIFGDDWTNTAQNQLLAWAAEAKIYQAVHSNQSAKFKWIYQCLSISLIFLTTIAAYEHYVESGPAR
jgi:hypothetical protein